MVLFHDQIKICCLFRLKQKEVYTYSCMRMMTIMMLELLVLDVIEITRLVDIRPQ